MNHEGHPPSEPALGWGNRGREVLRGENARAFIYNVSSTLVHFLARSFSPVLALRDINLNQNIIFFRYFNMFWNFSLREKFSNPLTDVYT